MSAAFNKVTEQSGPYRHLEKMSIRELLTNINSEDKQVPLVVARAIPQIEQLVTIISDKMLAGGRLFLYWRGYQWPSRCAGCQRNSSPLTAAPQGLVIGIIAGGQEAIQKPIEHAEDSWETGLARSGKTS